jgi:uncharacterized protein (DUF433 family)
MLCLLSSDDRRYLEKLAGRKMRPTSRQKAQALLRLDSGDPPENVSMRVGIPKEELLFLVRQFVDGGLEAVGLVRSQRKTAGRDSVRGYPTIEKTTGVCGGAVRIAGTRIPVWQLVAARETGASEGQLLMDFPRLEARNLVDAWAYAADHPKEIRAQIHANEVA